MDGYSQHNQPLPPLPPELQQNPPGYRRPSGSSAIPQPTQRGQAIPTFEGPVESFLQQQFLSGHLPGHLPRNMRPTIPQQYSDSTFTPIYGEPPAYTPQVLPQMPQVHFQGPYLGQAVNVPVWQPDNLVRTCPICNVAFTFYFRRHHCRKCGRVVCAPCSSQKIFLPSSAVVRNPTEVHSRTLSNQGSEISPFGLLGYNARGDFLGSRNTTETDPSGNRHSWTGGNLPDVFLPSNGLEEVRACDDCKVVTTREDEESLSGGNMRGIYRSWEGPPSNLPGRRQSGLETWSSSPVDMGASTAAAYGNGDGNGRRRRQSLQGGRSLPYTYDPGNPPRQMIGNTGQQSNLSQWAMNTNPGANSHSHPLGSYNSPTNVGIYYPQAPDSSRGRRVQAPSNHRSYTQVWIDPQRVPEAPHNAMRRVEQPGRTQIRQLQGHGASQRQTNSMPQPSVPPPTNLKETDYCPICTRILPPPHPDTGDETEREEHIQRCIAEQTSVSPRRGQGNRGSTSFGSTPGDDGSPRSSARNGRAMERAEAARRVGPSRGGVRSVSYVATENDTWDYNVDSDGEINDGPEGDDELDAAPGEIFLIGNENMKHQGAAIEDDDDVIITYSNIPEPPQTKSKVKQKTHKKKEKVRKKAECVICFGEFEAGEVISRLDCLCRYHKECVEDWWQTKNGNRECPVHAIRD